MSLLHGKEYAKDKQSKMNALVLHSTHTIVGIKYASGCMPITVYSGTGKDIHMSLYACIMEGEHDDYIVWPFRGMSPLINNLSRG